ncbi:MAG: TolC family protein [Pirellulales bacterium]
MGPRWTRHDGQIQDTRGDVLSVSRSALFVGSGATLSVDTSEARFAPLAARQVVAARQAGSRATTNSTLLEVSNGYWDLLRSFSNEAIVREAVENTQALERLAESYLRNEKLKQADAERIRAELRTRLGDLDLAGQEKRIVSARLGRLLRLDPFVTLLPAEDRPVPVEVVDSGQPRRELAATALRNRPELAESRSLAGAAAARLLQAQYGPWLPSLLLDYDAGGFGGGPNDFFGDFDGRSDVEAAAIWTVRNLGHGEWAAQRERDSEVRQARLRVIDQMDRVVSEVAEALARVEARRAQLETARTAVDAAQQSYELNLRLFREGGIELILPIEVVQSVNALTRARQDYLSAVVEYNRAQFQLLWALGFPLHCVGEAVGKQAG